MANTIDNTEDVLDSRDVIARVEELEEKRDTFISDRKDLEEELREATTDEERSRIVDEVSGLGELDEDDAEELRTLTAFMEEMKSYGGDEQWRGDWYPVTLIRDSNWQNYAQELAEELDLIKSDSQWPYTCIDWEKAARELQYDYTSAEFDGVTYWFRS